MGKQWRRVKQYSEGWVWRVTAAEIFIDHPDGSFDSFLKNDYIVSATQPNLTHTVRVDGAELEKFLSVKAFNVSEERKTYFFKM